MELAELKSEYFFRYRDFNNNTLDELMTGNVWHSKCERLNDPFEFNFEFDWDSFTIDNFAKINNSLGLFPNTLMENLYLGHEHFKNQMFDSLKNEVKRVVSARKEDIENSVFLCCFSSSYDNPLMWSHYANGMQGLCIAYQKDLLAQSNDFGSIIPIKYVDTPHKITFESLCAKRISVQTLPYVWDFSKKALNAAEVELQFSVTFKDYYYMFQKHSRWEYEGEHRNLVLDTSIYGANGCVKNIGEASAKAVIAGHKMPPTNLKILELICRSKGIKLYKASPNKSDYSVRIDKIS